MSRLGELLGSFTRGNIVEALARSERPLTAYRIARAYNMNVAKVYSEVERLEGLRMVKRKEKSARGTEYELANDDLRNLALTLSPRVQTYESWRSADSRRAQFRMGLASVPPVVLEEPPPLAVSNERRMPGELENIAKLGRRSSTRSTAGGQGGTLIAYERVKKVVLATEDPTERKIRFMALLTSSLPKGGRRPVLAGGSAIEVYLDGTLRTGDMDVVYDVKALEAVFKAWRFELGGGLRSWANDELGFAVDMVGGELEGSHERVTTITTDFGPATIIGIEDLIIKRLASAKVWRVATAVEQAYLLAKAHNDGIDWRYLEEEARKADIADYLAKLKEMLTEKWK